MPDEICKQKCSKQYVWFLQHILHIFLFVFMSTQKKKIVENNCSRLVCKTNVEFFGHIFSRVLTQFFFFFFLQARKKKKKKNNGIPYFFSFLFFVPIQTSGKKKKEKKCHTRFANKKPNKCGKKNNHICCVFFSGICVFGK